MLENLIASITKRMCDIANIKKVYFDEVDDGFVSPSIFIPTAEQAPQGDTLTSFRFDTALYFKVFANTTKEAVKLAENITTQISKHKNIINILNEDGSNTGETFRLKSISCKKADTGIAQIYVRFQTVFAFDVDTSPNAAQIVWNTGIK
ncbi:hypothetical protein [Anaerovorax sp. IOR16]|uniref:hypothetical protein n=1 Tax=Anaerovorax sp. IOR16 TaxID=2773458 RepID=UPI0019CFBA2B|nr:hypothetical protein [Anaerovorax sp. IOR16]